MDKRNYAILICSFLNDPFHQQQQHCVGIYFRWTKRKKKRKSITIPTIQFCVSTDFTLVTMRIANFCEGLSIQETAAKQLIGGCIDYCIIQKYSTFRKDLLMGVDLEVTKEFAAHFFSSRFL